MKQEMVRRCGRCNGCGQIVRCGAQERAWTCFEKLPVHQAVEKIMGMHRPELCPDCGGTGRHKSNAA